MSDRGRRRGARAYQAHKVFGEAHGPLGEAKADAAVRRTSPAVAGARRVRTSADFGARDFRDNRPHAIYVANIWPHSAPIAWHPAEPVLLSLSYLCSHHEGEKTPPSATSEPIDRAAKQLSMKKSRADGSPAK